MATINLAPGTQYLATIRRRRRSLLTLAGGIVLLLILTGTGLVVWQESGSRQLEELQASVASLERRIVEAGPDVERITLFEERLAALDQLLQEHLSYQPIFRELERLLPAPTVLQELTVTATTGEIEILASSPNVDEVAQTLASLSSDVGHATLFTAVELGNITRQDTAAPDGVVSTTFNFQATLHFDPTVLQQGHVTP